MIQQDGFPLTKIKTARSKREKYSKISLKTKIFFYHKVLHQQVDLRQMTQQLGIKYSTAKTFIRNYKRLPEEMDQQLVRSICSDFQSNGKARNRCSYQEIDECTQSSESWVRQQQGGCSVRGQRIEIICNLISSQER